MPNHVNNVAIARLACAEAHPLRVRRKAALFALTAPVDMRRAEGAAIDRRDVASVRVALFCRAEAEVWGGAR